MAIGLLNLENRSWVEIKGGDARKFLNGVLTNNIQKIQGKTGCYSLALTPKGKIVADCFCYTCGDHFGLDCDASLKENLLEHLKKYIVFQKVEVEDKAGKWLAMAVAGEGTPAHLSKLLKELPEKEFSYLETVCDDLNLWVIAKRLWGLPCFELWVKAEKFYELKSKLKLPWFSPEEMEMLRIESGTPRFGVDFDENTIPQEACLYSALSFDKGCFVGQEIVARLEHRGHVGKQLVQFFMEGTTPPPAGEKIFSAEGEEIGFVTSSCFSKKKQAAIALGYLRYACLNLSKAKVGQSPAVIQKLLIPAKIISVYC